MKALISSRRILSLSLPIIIAGIGETIVDVTDTIFLARYGIVELGAVALADALYGIAAVAVLAVVDGIQVLVARRAGEENTRQIGRTFNQGVYLLVLMGLAAMGLLKLGSTVLTGWLIDSGEVAAAANAFLQIVAYKIVFDGMNFAYGALLVGVGRTRPLVGATLVLAGTNVVLDYLLIFGHWGMPRLGIAGAAVSSVVSEVAAFAFLTASVLMRLGIREYGLFSFGRWDGRLARSLIRISSPVMLSQLVETLRWFLFFVIVERLGEEPLAVSNILYSCYVVFLIGLDGFSETTCSLASNVIGGGNASRLGALLRRAIALCYLVTAPLVVLSVFYPQVVLWVFTSDSQALEGLVSGLRVICLLVLIVIPSEMIASAVSGTGDTVGSFLIELATSLTILICAYMAAFSFDLPVQVVWTSEGVGWLVCGILSYFWLKSGIWRRLAI